MNCNRHIASRLGVLAWLLLASGVLLHAAEAPGKYYDGMPRGTGNYSDFVALWDEFREWRNEPRSEFGKDAITRREDQLSDFRSRLEDMAVDQWILSQQAEFLAVRAKFDQQDFTLRISRPWARDPGFYVDRLLRVTFTDLPASGEALAELERRLDGIPQLVAEAKRNLTDVAADYADLAIFNLSNADGVGHGYPWREVPPPGVIGWYGDLLERADEEQPELKGKITAAKAAVEDLRDWLTANRASMSGKAGVGEAAFNWYLRHVKLMPFTTEQIVTLGERELDRLWAQYALERHRNRNLPEIELPASAEDYQQRIDDTDRAIRSFLVDEEIITIPDYVGKLDTNVPWIVRDGGPNFWEQVQYRNPSPDHLHAVIPGHRFDALVERNNTHPVRRYLTDGARVEGWAVYLEEAMMYAGLLEAKPRVRELIYLFGIFRAARMPADVWLQTNTMTAQQVADYWIERVPWLDRDVARVDAEIYLRRPPGYGLGYMTGMLQMQQLLAEQKRRLGDDFSLKTFHDNLMAFGRLPLSLVRWEMTGNDDEVAALWKRAPMPVSR